MRLIDADEIRIKPEYMHDICGSVMIRVEDVARIINEMPTINPQPRWIPTSKECPPQYQEIWITSDLGDVELVYGKDGIWLFDGTYYTEPEIIAWMPANLPSPYEEEGEEE